MIILYFEISVLVGKNWYGTGSGTTKKAASQRAARQALTTLVNSNQEQSLKLSK